MPDISEKDLADLKAKASQVDDLAKQIADLKASPPTKKDETPPKDEDLTDKVKAKDKAKAEAKTLEAALHFNWNRDKFIDEHKSILPKDITDIFQAAEKEKFDSPIQKSNATKSALIQSFFKLQANVDLLTPTHKQAIDDYLKLTKNGKEELAEEIFKNVFEPTLGMLRAVKKAEEVSRARAGYAEGSEVDAIYRQKLITGSRNHHLGEKNGS